MLEVNTISEVISYMLTILGGGMVDLYKFSSSPIKPCLSSREKRGINYVNYVGERLEGFFFLNTIPLQFSQGFMPVAADRIEDA